MAEVKQILVVDDHFEMLEFLRSMLETSNRDYQVLGVPSAEEGFLELRRTPFDLLITDVRLPGMSGFELVRRVQAFRPDVPIVMITAYSSTQGQQEAEALGVYRYFQKPLNTDTLLSAVHTALYGEEDAGEVERPEPVPGQSDAVPFLGESKVRARLQGLRTDTGAAQVGLADAQGNLLIRVGPEMSLDFPRLTQIMAHTLENSLLLADELQSGEPLMIQYQSGARVDLYSANIGRDYFVMLFFETQARRGRIGTIWIFAQRAVNDLKQMLSGLENVGTEGGQESRTPPPSKPAATATETTQGSEPGEERRLPEVVAGEHAPETDLAAAPARPPVEAETEAEAAAPSPVQEEAFSEEFLAEIEGSEFARLFEEENSVEDTDLDAFWETAMQEEGGPLTSGLSLEEAREQGLIPPEFDEPEE